MPLNIIANQYTRVGCENKSPLHVPFYSYLNVFHGMILETKVEKVALFDQPEMVLVCGVLYCLKHEPRVYCVWNGACRGPWFSHPKRV